MGKKQTLFFQGILGMVMLSISIPGWIFLNRVKEGRLEDSLLLGIILGWTIIGVSIILGLGTLAVFFINIFSSKHQHIEQAAAEKAMNEQDHETLLSMHEKAQACSHCMDVFNLAAVTTL